MYRPFVRLAFLQNVPGLSFLTGFLLVTALALMIVGPDFGGWLAAKVGLGSVFAAAWPFLRWAIAVGFTVLAVELIYFLAPNVRQRFRKALHGATVAVGLWLLFSSALGFYFQNFGNLNKTYGTLAAAIALMVWLYWTAFSILLGGEINADCHTVGKRIAVKEAAELTASSQQNAA
jgi:membrane protein